MFSENSRIDSTQLKVRAFIFGANKVSLESVPGTWDYGVPYGFEMLAVPMLGGPILT